MPMKIYMDESGNTGSNLLDKQQPVFTTASCNFTDEEAVYLLERLGFSKADEVHFKRLRKTRSGQKAIIELLADDLICAERVKVHVINKEFMVLAKIIDILVEHYLNKMDCDLYKDGHNIALSNMLWYCLPIFCDADQVRAMYASFVNMMRTKEDAAISLFYDAVFRLKEASNNERFNKFIDLILVTRYTVHLAVASLDKFSIDPSIPSLFIHCAQWGEVYPDGFVVNHDDSNTLEQQQHMVTQFMVWSKNEIVAGYDRRKFILPLKSKKLDFVCSKKVKQIQIMDVLASALAYWAGKIISSDTNDSLFQDLEGIGFDNLVMHNKIWPEPCVNPRELGTIYDGGLNPADASAIFLMS